MPKANSPGEPPAGSLWRDTLSAQAEFSTGFDGILLVVALNRVLSPVLIGCALYVDLAVFIQHPVRNAFINSGYPDYYWRVAVMTLAAAIGASGALLFDLVLLWLFFRRRRAFRVAIIAFYLLDIALPLGVVIISFLFGEVDTDQIVYLGIASLWALVWLPYFIYSQRVKNTFVR